MDHFELKEERGCNMILDGAEHFWITPPLAVLFLSEPVDSPFPG